ncbi:biotin transport system substrate-specific component [Cribrihabitans marinus]|uniref:Biotin transporter n=1 Tax=Cribrihabitans marinus TaxID=1227549 RepID=A0A1H6REB2_9RHOB|nr:biotin transporter BioY [Cribrihabitans marinus]GGH20479.1 biotin biosynthesis protein BioY [Cribrihabitans marinus]SEI50867.1 biotin transport system substrate-specific component [Cribrihabitans marinus]
MTRQTVLGQAVIGSDTLGRKAAMVLGGSLFIAVAAQISVPMIPVPMTLQTLAILIVGLTFGSRLGAATLLAYLAEGAAGLPVFANGMSTAALVGPTAGFLVGFVLMAWLAGLAAERGLARGVIGTALVGIVASAVLYIPGVAWPMAVAGALGFEGSWVGSSADAIWTYWVSPFLLGDALKAVIAALVVTGGWAALKSRRG